MGVVGAIQALKAEADAFEACLEHIVKGGTDKFNPYLSGSSGSAHYTAQSDAQVTSNDDLYKTLLFKCNERTGTMKHTLDPVLCLGVHVALIEKLTVSHRIEEDGLPSLTLDARGGQVVGNVSKSGGFAEAYQLVNLPRNQFRKLEQDRCIFAMTNTNLKNVLGSQYDKVVTSCKDKLSDECKRVVTLQEGHVLFHWNAHSFFSYHQDPKGDAAAVVNLSPGKTNFHVAGKDDNASMDHPGEVHFVPTKAFHRSGTATRRCVKLVLFFAIEKVVDVDEVGEASSSDFVKTEAVPTEKTEGEEEHKE